MDTTPEPLWTTKQLADYLGVEPVAVRSMRLRGTAPAGIRIGRNWRYRPSDVQAWLDANTTRSALRPYSGTR